MKRIVEIKYDGKYPNLCSGVLEVLFDDGTSLTHKYALRSGGDIWIRKGLCRIDKGEWSLDEDFVKLLPGDADAKEFYSFKILKWVNENVDQGCCGGCT